MFETMNYALRPTSHLLDLIRRRDDDWHLVRLRIISHPNDVRYKTSHQATVLHQACLYRTSLDMIELLLNAYPDAIIAQDSEGWTPLHVALLYGANEELCLLLIRRGGVTKDGRYIGSPLHLACRHGASAPILQALLNANPAMAVQPNEAGAKPAHLVWRDFRKRSSGYAIEELQEEHVEDLLHRIGWILDAARGRKLQQQSRRRNDETASIPSLHDVVDLHSELHHLISIMIRLYPEQCSRRDTKGNLPLHVAASVRPNKGPSLSLLSFRRNNTDVLDQILHAYPSAANLPDGTGRLPLHLAVLSERTWKTGICSLVQASPQSITTRNILTHRYPAQEARDVDTIYQLILAWPPLLSATSSCQ